ncbi:MAG: hypothetical protein KatS3mg104_2710 [Phycisphaerae bacterium]|jgi:hypothetical protein|nr:MAG: hypothetical protein KatS3mg104_2710 [Phycisphaerae bacterium]
MKAQSTPQNYQDRFKSVDVLSLLDPNWLEKTRAAELVHLVRQQETSELEQFRSRSDNQSHRSFVVQISEPDV